MRTGRSPPGVAANQMSPRCIYPVGPVLGRAPIGDRAQRPFAFFERLLDPGRRVVLAGQAEQVATKSVPEQLGPIHAEPLGPRRDSCRLLVVHAEAQHCHTGRISRMTAKSWRAGRSTRVARGMAGPGTLDTRLLIYHTSG